MPSIPSPARPASPSRRSTNGQVSSFGDGRVCGIDGCTTKLSRYNAGAVCATHGSAQRKDR